MIVRMWRGWTAPADAEAYARLLHEEVFPAIRERVGIGLDRLDLLRRQAGAEEEFVTLLWFSDPSAIDRLAGQDREQAYVPPKARELLRRFDERSRHYEVADRAPRTGMIGSVTVGLPVDDLERAKDWYRRLFEAAEEEHPADGVWEISPAAAFWLQFFERTGPDGSDSDVVVRFETSAIESTHARLERLGGRDVTPVETVPNAVRYFDFEDPFGNRLSFYQVLGSAPGNEMRQAPQHAAAPGPSRRAGVDTIPILPSGDFDQTTAFYGAIGFVQAGRWNAEYLILTSDIGIELHFWHDPAVDPLTNDASCYIRVARAHQARSIHTRWASAVPPVGRLQAPSTTDYGLLEFALVDPHGNLLRVGGRL